MHQQKRTNGRLHCSYLLFIFIVFVSVELRCNPYYFLAAVLGICDCSFLVLTIFYSVPALMLQWNIGKSSLFFL